ncbi:MAG TPA: hypothetical protein QF353_04670 [Gammaproteobacteria bacterium]|nr:hypothetical protein [Gammaproteobacteria bacterium]
MRIIGLILITIATSFALSDNSIQFSDSVINLVYSFNPVENESKTNEIKPYFTQGALTDFMGAYTASKVEESAIKNHYIITSYHTSPTILIETSNHSFKTLSEIDVYYTNDQEQIKIPTQVYISAKKSIEGIKVIQFYSKTSGEVTVNNSKLNRYKQCHANKNQQNKI